MLCKDGDLELEISYVDTATQAPAKRRSPGRTTFSPPLPPEFLLFLILNGVLLLLLPCMFW